MDPDGNRLQLLFRVPYSGSYTLAGIDICVFS